MKSHDSKKRNKNLEIILYKDGLISDLSIFYKVDKVISEEDLIKKVIGKSMFKVFIHSSLTSNKAISKVTDSKMVRHLRIVYNHELIIDTRHRNFKIYESRFKFDVTGKSQREYAQLIYYLSSTPQVTLQIESQSMEQNNSVTELLKLAYVENDYVHQLKSFSEFQLASLCAGMIQSKPRKLAALYFVNNTWGYNEKIEVLKYVEKAILKYGNDLISYCLKLPKKPFYLSNCKRIFTQFDNNNNKSKEPLIRIVLRGKTIKLHRESSKSSTINIQNDNGSKIGSINKQGLVKLDKGISNYNITIALLISFAKDPLKQILYFGSHTGNCSFCGLPLRDSISLEHGYGKTCAKNYNLNWG